MVKVSVIIPVYNVEDYLEKCLESVLNQTLEDIEIICIDDCSTDNSLKILYNYSDNDSRVKVIENKKNRGQGFSRNIGIKHANGEYIAFVDSDDYLSLNLFETTFKRAKQLDLDLLLFKSIAFDNETGKFTEDNKKYLSIEYLNDFDKEVFTHEDTKKVTCNITVSPWQKIYKKDFLYSNNILFPEDIIFEDEVFFYKSYLNAKRISLLDEYLYYYRVNRKNSTIVRKDNKFLDVVDAFRLVRKEFINTNNYDNEYKKLLFNKFFFSIFNRFNETADKFKEEFYLKIKEDFKNFLKSQNDINLLFDSYKTKAINILFSKDYKEFCDYEEKIIPQKFSVNDIDTYYKLSVIIPVYNMENYLSEAIQSIINQSIGFSNIEVILVDDCSSDNSRTIIKEYCNNYENIKMIFLKENSGFAGKPRNVGIKYASADYIMFLDPDDSYFEDACEFLYEKITKNNVDIVSGNYVDVFFENNEKLNWNEKFGIKDDEIKVASIKENMNLFNIYPSVWAKIFKKDFILDNGITFPENLPGQDLFFVHHALFEAKGILFANKEIVQYSARDSTDDEKMSVSCDNSKNVLMGLIKLYYKHLDLFENYAPENVDIVLKSLYYWITKFIDSNLDISEIRDIVDYSVDLFEKFMESDNLQISKEKYPIFTAIAEKDYDKVIVELVKLNGNFDLVDKLTKSKHIFLTCYALESQIGGLAKAVLSRSKKLSNLGYKVTILTVDFGQNYDFIINRLRNENYLDENVNIVNLFDYYRDKNTLNSNEIKDIKRDNLEIKYIKTVNNDNSVDYDYFENKVKVKTERYFDNYLAIEKYFENDECIKEKAFTKDGFCFYEMFVKNNREFYCLNDRKLNLSIKISAAHEYNKHLHLHTHFMEEICSKYENKPFLVIESTGHIPSIGNVSSDFAYKIGQLHGNIFKEPYVIGSEIQSFSAINDKENLERVITLTESQKNDLIKEFGYERFVSIPNFIEENKLKGVEKDLNKVSFVSSISFHKNLFDLIKAFKIVIKLKKDAKLEIFGRAYLSWEIEELNKIKQFIHENGMEDNVIFRGYVDNIYDEMENSLVTVSTSHSEGFCLAILESMVCSTPVIAYNFNYGPSDMISNGKDGIIVEKYDIEALANAILDLLNNPNKAIKMGNLARGNVLTKFSDDVVISRWEKLFKDILDNHVVEPSTKLSVVIPIYNSEKYLNKCLNSITNQTLKDIEILCIDDCSKDNSLDILYNFASKDERIKIFSLNENQGQGHARNIGINKFKGEYLSFVDADDWIDENTFKLTYGEAKENSLDMVIFKLINFDDESNEFFETNYYNMNFLKNERKIFNHKSLLNKLFSITVGPVNKIYGRKMIKENNIQFPENYSMFEDNPFFHDSFLSSKRCSFISKKLYYRRIHSSSVMQNNNEKLFDIIPCLGEVISIFINHNLFDKFDHILFNHKVSVIKMWYERADKSVKEDFYIHIKKDFQKNRYINNILVESKLTAENLSFYKSILDSDTFKEFNLLLKLMSNNSKVSDNEVNFIYDEKLGNLDLAHLMNINRRYKEKIKYLEKSNKSLRKKLESNKSIFNIFKWIYKKD